MKQFNKKMLIASLSLGMSLISVEALAATSQTTSTQATATIATSCNLSVTNMNFGNYQQQWPSTTTSTLTTTCSKGLSYVMAISAGSSGDANLRTMLGTKSGNTDKLGYIVSNDSGSTTILGDIDLGNVHKTILTGTGAAATMTLYGRVPANQYITPDSYAETLTVTLTY